MAGRRLEDLNLRDELLSSVWSSYAELEQAERASRRVCLDDDACFACFCGVLRAWDRGGRWVAWSER